MKLPFGIEITRRKSAASICLDTAPVAAGEFPGLFYRKSGTDVVYSFRGMKPTLSIVWPEPPESMNPELASLALAGLVLNVEQMLCGSHFDICPIRSVITDFEIPQSPDSQVAMDILHSIHCVNYSKLPKGMTKRIPELLSCVFTGGAFPLSAPSVLSIGNKDVPEDADIVVH
ncbi:hypothetical protein IFT48_03495 [Pseudomonas fluorescens]|uniref:hypothetical protein n=1 Tax=Pseudomonas fluorescens TaxID=294 RepID=UPI001930E0F2|nr:hypothetical protein [Pseudomonas fluorescens]MBD8089034.1 hypothetical protein [Pseudomonas fluorescens]